MKFYIAGPMRGHDQFNFPAFDEAAEHLRSIGFEAVSPAEHDRDQGFDETSNSLDGFDLQAALMWDLEQVAACDAVLLLPGWETSTGAQLEHSLAQALGKPAYHFNPNSTWMKINPYPPGTTAP